jgi:gamma-glutamyltranspeptidase/glutathione hydrolase
MKELIAIFGLLLATTLITTSTASGQERWYGRSMVGSRLGIAATSQTFASQAAAQILARGGSAVDAAIAANAVLSVTEPMMNGMGGDMFAMYWDRKTGKLYGINASGWAPGGLSVEYLREHGFSHMPQTGIHAVTVPGAVAGWSEMHRRFGRLPWRDLFQPAIRYATDGYPVAEMVQISWTAEGTKLEHDAESRRVFLPGGHAPELGQIFRNPDYAHALSLVADEGPAAFYCGEIARAILATSQAYGGTMAASDLSEYKPEWVEPISTVYRGWHVYELPPNGQGIAALEMLNLMSQFTPPDRPGSGSGVGDFASGAEFGPLSRPTRIAAPGADSAEWLHIKIEAMKLAYADLGKYLGDPRFAKIPVAGLLSPEYARKRAAEIDPHRANCNAGPGAPAGSDTTYLAVVDRDGNIASWIQSLYSGFGSGITVKGMGFCLQNRGALFHLTAGPDVLQPRKRPFHTIIPGFMEKGNLHIGFGIMGGLNQPLAHAQFVSNIADYGMNLQEAVEAPRFTRLSLKPGCDVIIESRVGPEVIEQLRALGHLPDVRAAYAMIMGRGQAVLHDDTTGANFASSDPRADGAATPEPVIR